MNARPPEIPPLDEPFPMAEVQGRRRPALIWLLPLVTLLVGAWMVHDRLADQGPLVSLLFRNAEGIEPKKTRVRYRNLDVGVVEAVHFTQDLSQVRVQVRLDKVFTGRITEASRFWMVRPRIEGIRISGLETLLSGVYISMDLGQGGAPQWEFTGLEEPRTILSDTPGTFYQLIAADLGSLTQGAPVYFRRIAVGEVVKYALTEDQSQVLIDIFIRAPHDRQVRRGTRFSNVSGVELDLSAQGLKVGIESLAAIMTGGISFETPQTLSGGASAPEGSRFPLYPSRDQGDEPPLGTGQRYLLYFEDTVRGLSVGAPVEFRGIRVGRVADIAFEGDAVTGQLRIPVQIELEPERVPLPSEGLTLEPRGPEQRRAQVRALMERLVRQGLRARLEIGNLLTGQLLVELDFMAGPETAQVIERDPYPELPTTPSTFRGMTRSLTQLLAKLERLPLDEIAQDLRDTVAGAKRLVNHEALDGSLRHGEGALARLEALAATLESRAPPLLDGVTRASDELRTLLTASREAVRQAQASLRAVELVANAQGPLGTELRRSLEQVSATARSLRTLSDYLERHPEALLRGKHAP